jgi:hypothetical protein
MPVALFSLMASAINNTFDFSETGLSSEKLRTGNEKTRMGTIEY